MSDLVSNSSVPHAKIMCSHNPILDPEAGETVCSSCGVVLEEQLMSDDSGIAQEDYFKKISHAPGLGGNTRISTDESIRGAMKSTVRRMKSLDSRIRQDEDKSQRTRYDLTEKVCDKLALPEYANGAIAKMFVDAQKYQITRGRRMEEIAAACTLAICRKYGIPKSIREIGKVLDVKPKVIFRVYGVLRNTFDLSEVTYTQPDQFLAQSISKLGISEKILNTAKKIMKKIMDAKIHDGRSPMVVAAYAVYMACKKHNADVTQNAISETLHVTEVSMRNLRTRVSKSKLGFD